MKPRKLEMESNHYWNTHLGQNSVLPGWAKTCRRTRTRPGKPEASNPASDWAWISIPDSNKGFSGSDNDVCDFQALETAERDIENLPPKKRKVEPVFQHGPLLRNGSSEENGTILSPGPKRSKRLNDLNAGDHVRARNNIHTCDICYRAFRSYQALGGHKSHHNSKAHKTRDEGNESTTRVVNSVVVYNQGPEARPGRVVHKCQFCDRVFSNGQALGGHKRHCRRAVNGSVCYGVGHETGSRLGVGFDFDLNELPPGNDL